MSSRIADYRVRIGFGGGIGGRFRIGYSGIGGTDILTSDWAEFFDGAHDDVTDDVAEGTKVQISRGMDQRLAAIESGKVQLTLFHADDPSLLDPNEPTSPLNDGTVSPGFKPMRPLEVRAIADGAGDSLSLSGGVLTDETRATGVEGDGLPEGSGFGVWEATENLEAAAGADVSFEAGTTGYSTGVGNTISSDTTRAKFGAASCKAVYGGDPVLLSIDLTLG